MRKCTTAAWTIGCLLILACSGSAAWGAMGREGAWQPGNLLMAMISTLSFGLIGIILAILGFKLFDALTPFKLEEEICERQNIAVAILCAAMILGICIIVAAAVL